MILYTAHCTNRAGRRCKAICWQVLTAPALGFCLGLSFHLWCSHRPSPALLLSRILLPLLSGQASTVLGKLRFGLKVRVFLILFSSSAMRDVLEQNSVTMNCKLVQLGRKTRDTRVPRAAQLADLAHKARQQPEKTHDTGWRTACADNLHAAKGL